MKIVGTMRLCDEFVEEIDLTIGTLAAFCDEVCFLLHDVTDPRILAAMNRCRNLAVCREYTDRPWNHYYSFDQAYHLANDRGPDWVVTQDQDELLPFHQLRQAMSNADETGDDTLVLPVIHCWETPQRIVWPRLNRTGNHGKIFRGKNPDFTICHGGGCCIPGSPHRIYNLPFPYRHLGFMTESCRARRLNVAPGRCQAEAWADTPPPIFPYRPDWPIERWLELQADAQ